MSTPQLQPGMVVTPTVCLVSPLSSGGMGSVWIADHLALRTQVVVKFMLGELVDNAQAVERFSREAAAAAQVKSPHVVQMLDHGVTPGGLPFIVMERLEGNDVAKHLARHRQLSLAHTAEIIGQVCKALARAHERGIVHRDIKPDNIFLCEVGGGETFVKLLDFGIAKGGDTLTGISGTRTGAMIGTPFYMSPEQIVGAKDIDLRTDLWSLGVVVYECVVGVRPFEADSFGALTLLIHSASLPTPSAVDPSVPPAFDRWFAKACSRDPSGRFASAKEMADALWAVAGGRTSPRSASQGEIEASAPSLSAAYPRAASLATTGASAASTPLGAGGTNGGIDLNTGNHPPALRKGAPRIVAGAIAVVLLAIVGIMFAARGHAAAPSPPSAAALVTVPPPPTPAIPPPPPAVTLTVEPFQSAGATYKVAPDVPSKSGISVPASPVLAPPPSRSAAKAPSAKPASTPTAQNNEKDIF